MTTMIVKRSLKTTKKGIRAASKAVTSPPGWSNHDNQGFYDNITPIGLKALAEKGGLASGCDIKLLKPYWEHAHSVLDVGSGYGRTIEALLANGFEGEITALERSPAMVKYLKAHYGKQIQIRQMDIQNCFSIHEQFDVIFFLWSGLADFAQAEQSQVIWQLAQLLEPAGRLIIDAMPTSLLPIDSRWGDSRSFFIEKDNVPAYGGYMPAEQQINGYAELAKLDVVRTIHFKTETDRDRAIFVLS